MLDKKALPAAMAYGDLNRIRAGIAATPEASDYTSIQERVIGIPQEGASSIQAPESPVAPAPNSQSLAGQPLRAENDAQSLPPAALMPFDATSPARWSVPFAFVDYLELVDWTARAVRSDRCGYIAPGHPAILDRLGIDGEQFIAYSERLLKEFGTAVGAPAAMVDLCARRQTKYLRGIRAARRIFVPQPAAGTYR